MAVPQSGLIFHLTMDDIVGSTVISETGNNNATTEGAPSVVAGLNGNGIYCDKDQYQRIYIPVANLLPASGFTLTAIMKPNSQGTEDYLCMGKDAFGGGWGVFLRLVDGAPYQGSIVTTSSGTSQKTVNSNLIADSDNYAIITLRYKPGNWLDISVDDQISDSRLLFTETGIRASTFGFQVSGHPGRDSNGQTYTSGARDDVLAYNYVMTDIEVAELHDLLAAQFFLNGEISENLAVENWIVTAKNINTGSIVSADSFPNGPFSLVISGAKSGPCLVTVSPDIGNIWQPESSVIIGQKCFPTDPASTPYYFQCTIAGTTGTTEPAWQTGTPGALTTDGTAEWELVERIPQPITHGPLIPQ